MAELLRLSSHPWTARGGVTMLSPALAAQKKKMLKEFEQDFAFGDLHHHFWAAKLPIHCPESPPSQGVLVACPHYGNL